MAMFIIQMRVRNARTRVPEWRPLPFHALPTYKDAERMKSTLFPNNPPFVRVSPI